MVKSFGSRDVFAGEYCCAVDLTLLTFHITATVQSLVFVPCMGLFLIDSWNEIENEKQINFLRQGVSLSGELVPLE